MGSLVPTPQRGAALQAAKYEMGVLSKEVLHINEGN